MEPSRHLLTNASFRITRFLGGAGPGARSDLGPGRCGRWGGVGADAGHCWAVRRDAGRCGAAHAAPGGTAGRMRRWAAAGRGAAGGAGGTKHRWAGAGRARCHDGPGRTRSGELGGLRSGPGHSWAPPWAQSRAAGATGVVLGHPQGRRRARGAFFQSIFLGRLRMGVKMSWASPQRGLQPSASEAPQMAHLAQPASVHAEYTAPHRSGPDLWLAASRRPSSQ